MNEAPDELRERTPMPAAPTAPPPIPPQTVPTSPFRAPRRGLTGLHIAFIVLGAVLVMAIPGATGDRHVGNAGVRLLQARVRGAHYVASPPAADLSGLRRQGRAEAPHIR